MRIVHVVHSRPCACWTYQFCFHPPFPSPEHNAVQVLFINPDTDGWQLSRMEESGSSAFLVLCILCVYCVAFVLACVWLREFLACVCVNLRSWSFVGRIPAEFFTKRVFLMLSFSLGDVGYPPKSLLCIAPQLSRLAVFGFMFLFCCDSVDCGWIVIFFCYCC